RRWWRRRLGRSHRRRRERRGGPPADLERASADPPADARADRSDGRRRGPHRCPRIDPPRHREGPDRRPGPRLRAPGLAVLETRRGIGRLVARARHRLRWASSAGRAGMTARSVVIGADGRAKAYRPLPDAERARGIAAGLEAWELGDW